MKKYLVILLSLTVVFVCFAALVVTASAGDNSYLDLRPVTEGDAQFSVTGATVVVNTNGTATVTLTDTSAVVTMTYKDGGAIYTEAYVDISTAKYVKYFYNLSSTSMTVDIHAHYDRGNKDNADLYLSGMNANTSYYKLSGTNYGVWDMYQYLSERSGYLPADNIIKFSDITYTIGGAVGDVFTLYYFEVDGTYEDNFGTVIPDEGTVDLSEDESSSEAVSGSSSENSTEQSQSESGSLSEDASVVKSESSAETSTGTPITGDAGILVLAVVSVVALAGAVVIKRR